jgi:hypothetical protein
VRGTLRVAEIVRDTPWLMDALVAAREVDAPGWLIGAGAVRTAACDRLHGFDEPTELADVDVAFFAAVHLWYPAKFGYEVPPLTSTEEAVATWPETATCFGVRLDRDDSLTVVAPYGVDDLLGMIHRRHPARVSIEEYERRLRTKRIAERWPRVRVVG